MANEVQICNLALARLGDDATVASIDPPESSAQSNYCASFYPLALGSLLEMHDWGFATRTASLTQLVTPAPAPWQFAYSLPLGLIKVVEVLPTGGTIPGVADVPYAMESLATGQRALYTDMNDATIRYIVRATDAQQYSPLFIDALAWLLASHLAGPIIKGDAGANMAKSCMSYFMMTLAQAKVSDSNQQRSKPEANPSWITGR